MEGFPKIGEQRQGVERATMTRAKTGQMPD